jgi:voltage-gated potassium channel
VAARDQQNKHITLGLEIVGGLVIYFILIALLVEFENDSNQASITNFSNAIWFSIVTLTTVGYGDIYPITIYGRIIGYIFLFISLGIYGLLIGQFTTLMTTIKENSKLGYGGTSFEDHAIIIGWNDFGKAVADQLVGVGKKVAIITDKATDIDIIKEKYRNSRQNIYTLYADYQNLDMLSKANIEDSSIVFINFENDTEKLVYVLNLKKLYSSLRFVVTLDNANLRNTFLTAGVTNTISKNEIASKLLASYMFEPDVAEYSEDIMSIAETDADYDIKQLIVTEKNPYLNKPYQAVFFDIKKRFNVILIGLSKLEAGGKRKLLKNPTDEQKIEMGDYMIMILNKKSYEALRNVFQIDEGYVKKL